MPATITRRLVSLADAADALAVSAGRRSGSSSTRSSGSSTRGRSATGGETQWPRVTGHSDSVRPVTAGRCMTCMIWILDPRSCR